MKTYSIVGTSYTGLPENFLMQIERGEEAILVREPDNPVDHNAVAIYIRGKKVGFIPRKQNSELARLIEVKGREETIGLAMDAKLRRTLPAKFTRSPNSGFPMVEV